MCIRCEADPQPKHFASPRRCAFSVDGSFTRENWNCATISALLGLRQGDEHYGDDETMQVVSVRVADDYGDTTDGWVVLARYKHRGCTSNAAHITQEETRPLTLELAEAILKQHEAKPC